MHSRCHVSRSSQGLEKQQCLWTEMSEKTQHITYNLETPLSYTISAELHKWLVRFGVLTSQWHGVQGFWRNVMGEEHCLFILTTSDNLSCDFLPKLHGEISLNFRIFFFEFIWLTVQGARFCENWSGHCFDIPWFFFLFFFPHVYYLRERNSCLFWYCKLSFSWAC